MTAVISQVRRRRAWSMVVLTVFIVGACSRSPEIGIQLDLTDPGDQVVSVPFTVMGQVTWHLRGTTINLSDQWSTSGPLDPSSKSLDKNDVTDDFTDVVTFTCLAAGPARIEWEVTQDGESGQASGTDSASFECKEPEESQAPVQTQGSVETQAPTGSPTPTKLKTVVSSGVGPVGGGNVEGDVQLAAVNGETAGTDIVVEAKGPSEALPVTLNQGGCDKRGSLVQALSPLTNGESSSRLPQALADYLTGWYSVHIATSAKPDADVACGVIGKGRIIALGAGRDGDQTPADVALMDHAPYGTEVSVFATPDSVSAVQPLAIMKGSCPGGGTVAFKLTDARGGRSRTDVEEEFDKLLSGGYSIQLSRSAAAPVQIVACGDLQP